MSRNPRSLSESGIYHVMFRGTNKQKIFCDKNDYQKFLDILFEVKKTESFDLLAYCLMSNHGHFVIKEKELGDISKVMHRLLTKYARWFNIKYDRTGVLMENRYKSKPVENDEYFMHVIRYIHQNPQKAELVSSPEEYPWSSYRLYLSKSNDIETTLLYELLPPQKFVEFHAENEEREYELFDNSKLSDYDLMDELKKLNINSAADLLALKYSSPQKFYSIIENLKKKFSDRHIERVTGISRYKMKP